MRKNKYLPTYLPFYYECIETGYIPRLGLCSIFGIDQSFRLLCPTSDDYDQLQEDGLPMVYWGKGGWEYSASDFSPLRQNIVLFMAAMNGEL